jgi:glutathione S-transferase
MRYAAAQMEQSLEPSQMHLEPVSWLLEEFADEWVSRWFIYSRWHNRRDFSEVSADVGRELTGALPGLGKPLGWLAATGIKKSLRRGGVTEENRSALSSSRDRTLAALEAFLTQREEDGRYLLTNHPTPADFGFYGQLEQFRQDPTGSDFMRGYPAICGWLNRIDRMRLPHPVVAASRGEDVELENLNPLFAEFIGTYLQTLVDNAVVRATLDEEASEEDGDRPMVSSDLPDGTSFDFPPSGYLRKRLSFVLEQLDRVFEYEESLLGDGRLRIRSSVLSCLEPLTSTEETRELLAGCDHLPLAS